MLIQVVYDILSYVLPFLLMIGILVTLHEFGHYYAARTLGIQVAQFSVGIGPALYVRTDKNGCRWQVCILPIGGFVRFVSELDDEGAMMSEPIPRPTKAMSAADERKYFARRSPMDRAFVILAGPVLNLLLGLVIISTLYVAQGRPHIAPVIDTVIAGMPAEKAGIRPGDRVLSINGIETASYTDVYKEIALHPKEALTIQVRRGQGDDAQIHSFEVITTSREIETFGVSQTAGQIGITSTGEVEMEQIGPITALLVGADDVWQLTRSMVIGLGQIASGARPLTDIGGPVKIAEMSGNAYQAGFVAFVFLLAAISINLGVMNLFPLPVLDGGQLIVCAVEQVIRRPVSPKTLYYIHSAGAVVMLFCMVGLTVNDLLGLLARTNL